MPKILVLANQKGGVGKTTLAINLGWFFKNYLNICLIDADPQGNLYTLASSLTKGGLSVLKIANDVYNLKQLPYDVLVIDTPPYLSPYLKGLLSLSDFILIPTKTSPLDILSIKPLVYLINNAKEDKNHFKSGIVLNMVKRKALISNKARNILKEYNMNIFPTNIGDRVSFMESITSGGVFSTNDENAKQEIKVVGEHILELMVK